MNIINYSHLRICVMEDDSVEAGQYRHVVIMIFTSHRSTFNCILKLKDELSI